MTELEQFIEMKKEQKRPVTETTIKKYITFYTTLRNYLGGRDITDETVTEEVLINVINAFKMSSSGKLNYQNIAVMIKNQHNQPTEKLVKYKEQLTEKKDLDTTHKVQQKLAILPSYETIRKYIDELFIEGDYSKYLVNELIFSFGLRNVDINLIITTLPEYKDTKKNDLEKYERENWLVLKKNSVELVINRYKTKGSHGTKNIEVKLKKVVEAGNKLGSGWLIQNNKNEPVNDDRIHNFISLMEYNGVKLKQGDYFKISLLHLQSQPNSLHKINMLSKTRGSKTLDTLDKHYNLENGKEDQEL
jgi:hypothetical protein